MTYEHDSSVFALFIISLLHLIFVLPLKSSLMTTLSTFFGISTTSASSSILKQMKLGRIVAVGGQSVDFPKDGGYTVDGYQPSEEITYQTFGADGVKYPIDVGDDEVFIMNDFRSDTDDSRQFGCVKKSDIDGKLLFLIRRRGF